MKTRILRFLLLAILVATGSGAVLWTWALAEHVTELEDTGRQTSARIDRLEGLLDELTRDELVYVASGRIDDETLAAGSRLLRQVVSESALLLGQILAGAAPAAGAVADSVASIAEIDARARDNMRAGLLVMAGDLIFTETSRTRQALREQLRSLRAAEFGSVAAARSSDLKQAWMALGVVGLLFAWALIRSPRGARSPSMAPASDPLRIIDDVSPDGSLASRLDLAETAAVCTAIARLRAEDGLQTILEQTASLLGASGVVVWMGAGDELFAAAGQGYNPRQLNRLGPINRSALNATAGAWRTGTIQTVTGDADGRAAIVAPMLGADRCIGVLALELAAGREGDPAAQAVAAMIAAQLATVLVAWPDGSSGRPAEVVPFERVSVPSSP